MGDLRDHEIQVLNGLIEMTLDSAQSYEDAAKEARSGRVKSWLDDRAVERRQLKSDLQSLVRILGAEPTDERPLLTALHRVFLSLAQGQTESDRLLVEQIELGETALEKRYAKALQDPELSDEVKHHLAEGHRLVKAGRDGIDGLGRGRAGR